MRPSAPSILPSTASLARTKEQTFLFIVRHAKLIKYKLKWSATPIIPIPRYSKCVTIKKLLTYSPCAQAKPCSPLCSCIMSLRNCLTPRTAYQLMEPMKPPPITLAAMGGSIYLILLLYCI